MAEWKKVIVSGSDAELNTLFTSSHITASGDVSASKFWFGNVPESSTQEWLVVYDPTTGQMKRRQLSSFPGLGS